MCGSDMLKHSQETGAALLQPSCANAIMQSASVFLISSPFLCCGAPLGSRRRPRSVEAQAQTGASSCDGDLEAAAGSKFTPSSKGHSVLAPDTSPLNFQRFSRMCPREASSLLGAWSRWDNHPISAPSDNCASVFMMSGCMRACVCVFVHYVRYAHVYGSVRQICSEQNQMWKVLKVLSYYNKVFILSAHHLCCLCFICQIVYFSLFLLHFCSPPGVFFS